MMKRLVSNLLALTVATSVVGEPAPIYENYGSVTEPPQIDATAFFNAGRFDLSGVTRSFGTGVTVISSGAGIPYSTQNTLYYTNANSGLMRADGFEFDFAEPTKRSPAAVVENRGRINGGARLLISSTNVMNRGLLSARGSGMIRIRGENVDLAHSGIRTLASSDSGDFSSGFIFNETNYINGGGVDDVHWGIGTNGVLTDEGTPLDITSLTLPEPASQPHEVVTRDGFTNIVTLPGFGGIVGPPPQQPGGTNGTNVVSGPAYRGFAFTNAIDATNTLVQAVFVSTNFANTNMSVDVRFAGSGPGRDVIVQYALKDIDITTGQPFTNFAYLIDRAGTLATTNLTMLQNALDPALRRPRNYEVARTTPFEWLTATPGNTPFTNSLITGAQFPQTTVTNIYTAYSADITSPQPQPSVLLGDGGGVQTTGGIAANADPTNRAGRVKLKADKLDLTQARIRSEGLLSIEANELIGQPRGVDAAMMNIDLKSQEESLSISNLIADEVQRLSGNISAWTGIFTNQMAAAQGGGATNQPPGQQQQQQQQQPNQGDGNTNAVNVQYTVLVVDHQFDTSEQVTVRSLTLENPNNITLEDNFNISRSLKLTSPSIHIKGSLDAPGNSIGKTNFVNTLSFTNDGTISFVNLMNFGTDRDMPYEDVVNRGTLFMDALQVDSERFNNGGQIQANSGPVQIAARETKLDNGQMMSGGDFHFKGEEFKAQNSTLTTTNGGLVLDYTRRLGDNGVDSTNVWTVRDGFRVPTRPSEGDLLGTEILSVAPIFARVDHTWPARDVGNSVDGFTNNLALGKLTLDGENFSQFRFNGATDGKNALYVENLMFANNATNVLQSPNEIMAIGPDMKVYFANSNLSAEELSTIGEEELDGRLIWVQDFAGANSSVEVSLASGETYSMNASLANSSTIDSDGDGLVNAEDPEPLMKAEALVPRVTFQADPTMKTELSWESAADSEYRVEYCSDLGERNWETLGTKRNATDESQPVTFEDPLTSGIQIRFYRVIRVE